MLQQQTKNLFSSPAHPGPCGPLVMTGPCKKEEDSTSAAAAAAVATAAAAGLV